MEFWDLSRHEDGFDVIDKFEIVGFDAKEVKLKVVDTIYGKDLDLVFSFLTGRKLDPLRSFPIEVNRETQPQKNLIYH